MATYTLATAIGADTSPIDLTSVYALTGSGYRGRLSCESEIMYVTGGAGTTAISVLRGQDGTDAAAHAGGVSIVDANLGATSGSALTIEGVTTFTATTIVAAGATESAPGEATLAQGLTNPLTDDLDADGNAITGLADPTDAQDAATKAYVLANAVLLGPATVTLDAADLTSLGSVPVEVVPAPGAGFAVYPVAATAQYVPGAVAFTDDVGLMALAAANIGSLDGRYGDFVSTPISALDPILLSWLRGGNTATDGPDAPGNQPLVVVGQSDIAPVGAIATASLGSSSGLLYAPGDTGTVEDGDDDATYEVDTVDGGGAVVTFHITAGGTLYAPSSDVGTSVTTGSGDGNFLVDIDTITPQLGDGSVVLNVWYVLVPIA